jgi:hypothetical protein
MIIIITSAVGRNPILTYNFGDVNLKNKKRKNKMKICNKCVKKYEVAYDVCPMCASKLRPIIFDNGIDIVGGKYDGERITVEGVHAGRCRGYVEKNFHSNGDELLVCRKCFLRIEIKETPHIHSH